MLRIFSTTFKLLTTFVDIVHHGQFVQIHPRRHRHIYLILFIHHITRECYGIEYRVGDQEYSLAQHYAARAARQIYDLFLCGSYYRPRKFARVYRKKLVDDHHLGMIYDCISGLYDYPPRESLSPAAIDTNNTVTNLGDYTPWD
jgi:hypothetical protein